MPDQLEKTPFTADAIKKKSKGFLGIDKALAIRAFFGGNALTAIIILALITIFLFREGAEFFPQNRRSLEIYRASGQELVGVFKQEVEEFEALQRELNAVKSGVMTKLYDSGLEYEAVNEATAGLRSFAKESQATVRPLKRVVQQGVTLTRDAKDKYIVHETRRGIEGADLSVLMTAEEADAFLKDTREQVVAMVPDIVAANKTFRDSLEVLLKDPPTLDSADDQVALDEYVKDARKFLGKIAAFEKKINNYNAEKKITLLESIGSFLFGLQWTTNSSWQDFYGIWPLLSGSLLVSAVALFWAIPFGVFAAIYINQVATPKEQNFIKPYIEFISAIPSVVIGFFGIAVFGEGVRLLSQQPWMSWVPFFPISERLNAFTAGGLLALMAVPTIFTLAEDAINNVPKAYKEASVAMGATRWQTISRIMIPTALSGIISAVLLGFGRVIGETMVVLLCAGNRIAVPDMSKGLGVYFEPVHTMTGIIAQEMGEVVPGSLHYRALFIVGIFLFFLSLLINYLAQVIVRRYKISAG
jgi:phosphate transport system permease protein